MMRVMMMLFDGSNDDDDDDDDEGDEGDEGDDDDFLRNLGVLVETHLLQLEPQIGGLFWVGESTILKNCFFRPWEVVIFRGQGRGGSRVFY